MKVESEMPRHNLKALLEGRTDAAASASSIKGAMATLKKLREAGFAGISKPAPATRRSGVPAKPMPASKFRQRMKSVYKVTFSA